MSVIQEINSHAKNKELEIVTSNVHQLRVLRGNIEETLEIQYKRHLHNMKRNRTKRDDIYSGTALCSVHDN